MGVDAKTRTLQASTGRLKLYFRNAVCVVIRRLLRGNRQAWLLVFNPHPLLGVPCFKSQQVSEERRGTLF